MLLLGGLLALTSSASAAVTAGSTTPLVNAGQLVRDGSTAVPIFGITATSTSGADELLTVTVVFAGSGFTSGNSGDLLALSTNPARSGVALYEDVGSVPAAFDSGDVGVTATAAAWNGNQVILSYAEAFPAVPSGAFDWILVVRTSSNAAALANREQIIPTIPTGGIVFSGPVSQPTASVTANALTVSLTSVADLLAPQAWVGPSYDTVNAEAVLGIEIVDGGIPMNRGIADQLSEVIVQVIDVSGTFAGDSLLTPNVNPALSGIGLYRDSNANGVWDPSDSAVTLSSISRNCVGPIDVEDWCLFPSNEAVPNAASTGYAYFVVVRTNAMGTGDDFRFAILSNQILVSGVHADDANRPTLLASSTSSDLLGDSTPPCVTTGCGQPFAIHWSNPTASPYLYPEGRTLYFSHGMGPSSVPGQVVLSASDDGSGLAQAVFTTEPSLAGSPAPMTLTGSGVDVTVAANYSFNETSNASSSPASVTVYDAVGNHATAPLLSFVLDAANPLIAPAPGWTNLPNRGFYVGDNGTLWFSPWTQGTQTVDIRVDLSDSIAGLKNATATSEPSLAGGPFYRDPTNLGGTNTYNGWTVSYAFDAASRDASSPATVTVCDEVANCANASFPYALDATPPNVTILAPGTGAILAGRVIVAATANDTGSGLSEPLQVEILGETGFMDMVWNGTAWVLPMSTALYADGSYRLVVRAFDNVGNEGVAVVDVVFENGAPAAPTVLFLGPVPGGLVGGVVRVQVSVVDTSGVASVALTVGTTTLMMASLGNDVYAVPLDTTAVASGSATLTVTAKDVAGLATTRSESILVDNSPPVISLGGPSADHGAIVLRANVTDSPAGVANVVFVVDGKTYAAVADGSGGYAVTLWTTVADDGVHAYEVIATDRLGNTATQSAAFSVNNPVDAYGVILAFAPLGVFLVLLVALILGLLLWRRRGRSESTPAHPDASETPKRPGDEL